jgi:hydroxymethylbilane synthase
MSKTKHFKIGTRGSLLAVTQCTLIKEEMERRTGASFELVKIKTQGDQQTEKPLWQMDGKDFFTKELDEALLSNQVDLVVHSYKDLGSDRPNGIKLAAITKRHFAHDILLIKKDTISKLKNNDFHNNENEDCFIVGTSSPRRIVNVESSLKEFIPGLSDDTKVQCEMLRGNVNTRIQKLRDGQYDAIVLALAGLERLANKEESLIELKKLLDGLNFMVMPQKVFPSSASQGALAIEYHSNGPKSAEIYNVLKSVHDETTELEVARERKAFQSFGGGCHLAVGINVKKHKDFFLHSLKGVHNEQVVNSLELEGVDLSSLKDKSCYVVLGEKDLLIDKAPLNPLLKGEILDGLNYFVTSKYCYDSIKKLQVSSIWSSGIRTMKQLVRDGHWVNGSAEGLGHEVIANFKRSKAISLMLPSNNWKTLTHDATESPIGEIIGCYQRVIRAEVDLKELLQYDCIYWNSFYQYTTYCQQLPALKNKIHLCGLGKTFDQFQNNSIKVTPIADMKTLKNLTRTNI